MKRHEPHSSDRSAPGLFLVGKDSRGNWIVQDQSGLCGGIFGGRTAALKFAMSKNGNRPDAVIAVPGVLEFDLSGKPNPRRVRSKSRTPVRQVA
jgi:hypothetical protein